MAKLGAEPAQALVGGQKLKVNIAPALRPPRPAFGKVNQQADLAQAANGADRDANVLLELVGHAGDVSASEFERIACIWVLAEAGREA
jgi:hypothetical protein